MITSTEAALISGYNDELGRVHRQGQAVVDRQDAIIDALRAKVRRLEAELGREKAARFNAEIALRRRRH